MSPLTGNGGYLPPAPPIPDCEACQEPVPAPVYPEDYWGRTDRSRPFHADCLEAAAERQQERAQEDPPVSLDEAHRAAWKQKQELNK
ncbi:MAG: hypothetical protein KGR26_13560 [Cyanobacteria bacterium REEB65]|nr:hypothetical protein [Cyanobacteria bacterium REEB65]